MKNCITQNIFVNYKVSTIISHIKTKYALTIKYCIFSIILFLNSPKTYTKSTLSDIYDKSSFNLFIKNLNRNEFAKNNYLGKYT